MTKQTESKKLQPHEIAVVQQLQLWEQAGLGYVTKSFAESLKTEIRRTNESMVELSARSESKAVPPASEKPTRACFDKAPMPTAKGLNQATLSSVTGTMATRPGYDERPGPGDCEAQLPYPGQVAAAERARALKVLSDEVVACRKCDALVSNRTQTVFGVGNPQARLCFVGEAPGADEDRQGEPFVGAAGQLLNKILTACKLERSDVYILNTIKCRPPGNRNPAEQEISNCWHFARRQLEILQPEFICCLGGFAVRGLLGSKQSIARLRGKFHQYRGSRVVVTYHPAFLLREPRAKYQVWDDMKMLMREMGVDL